MSEIYIKAILGKEASMQACLKLVQDLKESGLIKSVDVESELNRPSVNADIVFQHSPPRWNKDFLDKDKLEDDLKLISDVSYNAIDLMSDLHQRVLAFDKDFELDCLDYTEGLLDEIKDVEETINRVHNLIGKFKIRLKEGTEE